MVKVNLWGEPIEQQQRPEQCDGFFYTIQQGDTFYKIAQRYGISLQALVDANPQVPDPARINPGLVICVPVEIECPGGVIYTVKPGDTLSEIAQDFGVSLQAILQANPQITDPDVIFAGQRICIPGVGPGITLPCCAVLSPAAGADLPPLARGSALIQEAPDGNYAVTFTAVGLPNPSTLVDFDTYIGTIRIVNENVSFSAFLSEGAVGEQPTTWCGTRIFPDNPQAAENTLSIRPINFDTGVTGSAVLTGTVGNCRS